MAKRPTDRPEDVTHAGGEAPERTPGERIKAARAGAGLTQRELANRMGVTLATISDYECGRRVPTLDWCYRVAVALGCKPSELDARLTDRIPTPYA